MSNQVRSRMLYNVAAMLRSCAKAAWNRRSTVCSIDWVVQNDEEESATWKFGFQNVQRH